MVSDTSLILIFLFLSITAVVVLGFVVMSQSREIKKLKEPKYGFLGKPLLFIAALIIGAGGFGLYTRFQQTGISDVPVSDTSKINLEIRTTVLNSNINLYKFNAVPVYDGIDWGFNTVYRYTFDWKIINSIVINKEESNRHSGSEGGIVIQLEDGKNRIYVTTDIVDPTSGEAITLENEIVITI